MSELNITLFEFIFAFGQLPVVSSFVIFCAVWLPLLLVAGAVVYAMYVRDGMHAIKESVALITPAFVAMLAASIIKVLSPSLRPFAHPDYMITPLVRVTGFESSFPSMHTAFAFALASALYARDRRVGKWFMCAAALVAFGRIASGVHWPIDILGGMLLGVVIGLTGSFRVLIKKKEKK